MDKDQILAKLTEYYTTYHVLPTTAFEPKFVQRAIRQFGSWRSAQLVAGYTKPRPYDLDDVLFYTYQYFKLYGKDICHYVALDGDTPDWVPTFKDCVTVWREHYKGGQTRTDFYTEWLFPKVKAKYFKNPTLAELVEWGITFYKSHYGHPPTYGSLRSLTCPWKAGCGISPHDLIALIKEKTFGMSYKKYVPPVREKRFDSDDKLPSFIDLVEPKGTIMVKIDPEHESCSLIEHGDIHPSGLTKHGDPKQMKEPKSDGDWFYEKLAVYPRYGYKWTEREEAYLENNYFLIDPNELERKLGRPYSAIERKANRMGKYKTIADRFRSSRFSGGGHRWSIDNIETLREFYGKIPTQDLGERLKRTVYAIHCKAHELGLNFFDKKKGEAEASPFYITYRCPDNKPE